QSLARRHGRHNPIQGNDVAVFRQKAHLVPEDRHRNPFPGVDPPRVRLTGNAVVTQHDGAGQASATRIEVRQMTAPQQGLRSQKPTPKNRVLADIRQATSHVVSDKKLMARGRVMSE
ncbi:MAG: hypothetical protein ACKOBM_09370, partial [Gammaproteobacteria bacterium]